MALIAVLPDPTDPAIVPLSAALLAFLATARSRLRGACREDQQDAAFEGAFLGTGVGLTIYLATLLLGLT